MFDEYQEFVKVVEADKSSHTVRSYKSNLTHFFDDMSIQNLGDLETLTAKNIRKYMSDMKTTKKPSSINARMRVIKAFCYWLIENNYMSNNPLTGVKFFKETKKIAAVLTDEERDKIILSCKDIRSKFLMALMLYTGMRREEVTNLKIKDIENSRILIHGKGSKDRLLALNQYVSDLFVEYMQTRKDDCEYIFCSDRNFGEKSGKWHKVSTESIRTSVKRAAELAGISPERIEKISCHTLRRTFACDLASGDANTFQIQAAMGHENILTTRRYIAHAGATIADKALMNQKPPKSKRLLF